MVTTAKSNTPGLTTVLVDGIEIGYVAKSQHGGWRLVATQFGNYARLGGLRTKRAAIEALARTAA